MGKKLYKGSFVKICITLSSEEHLKLKMLAVAQKTSMMAIVKEMIDRKLEREGRKEEG
jgi:hypothetical protein